MSTVYTWIRAGGGEKSILGNKQLKGAVDGKRP